LNSTSTIAAEDDASARTLPASVPGAVFHTSKPRLRPVETHLAFRGKSRALAFVPYLKSGSGRAFAKNRL